MKKYLAMAVGGLALAFSLSVQAATIPITNNGDGTDDPFQGGGDVVWFEWLKGEILSWNNHPEETPIDLVLPEPTTALTIYEGAAALDPISVVTGDYLVLHYGVGPDGDPGTGGGLVAIYALSDGMFQAPATGSGPNGTGGLSFVRLWDHDQPNDVPDGGATAMLLGGVLSGIALLRRKLSV
jgi:hypothetical protein